MNYFGQITTSLNPNFSFISEMELKILLTKHNIYHFGYCILYCLLVHPTDIYGIPIVRKILLLGSEDGSLGKTRTVFALMESMGTDHYQINHAPKKLQIFFKDESEIPVFIGFPHSLQTHNYIPYSEYSLSHYIYRLYHTIVTHVNSYISHWIVDFIWMRNTKVLL